MQFTKKKKRWLGVLAGVLTAYALFGFLAAPWLLKKQAVESVDESLGADLRLAEVAINPFVLSLRITGLELDDPQGVPFARVAEIFVNFQLSSLFRWAWTFGELRISGPQIYLSRSDTGVMNTARFRRMRDPVEDRDQGEEASGSGTPRLRIFDFALSDAAVHWADQLPREPVDTRFGPVDIHIEDLNTLPQKPGSQSVVIQTDTTGTISWNGSLQFNPFQSSGHASITGSHFPLTSAYLKYQTGFEVVEGDADLQLDYNIESNVETGFSVVVENIDIAFRDVLARTFSGADRGDIDREIVRLPLLRLSGASVRWPEQQVNIASIGFDQPQLNLHRDAAGQINVLRTAINDAESSEPEPATTAAPGGNPWAFALGELTVSDMRIDLDDESVQPAAEVGIQSLNLEVRDIDNRPGTRFPTSLTLDVQSGGSLTLQGNLAALPELLFEFDIGAEQLALAGAHPYLTGLADVNLDSGALGFSGKLLRSSEEPLAFSADVEISNLLITETDEGSRLGSWDSVLADNLVFSAAQKTLNISEIHLQKPYGDVLIAADGSVNLGRAVKSAGNSETGEASEIPDEPSEPFALTIGRVIVADAAADFSDLSLPLPFSAEIAEINGELTTIATTSSEPSNVSLEGTVDEFGLFRLTGVVTPMAPAQNTDIKLEFQNVDMPKFSAYSIPFAGREIESGRLDLDLGYLVNEGTLEGENKIVLRDFELGETVPHPDAMSLPLGLAVALLKDGEGKIDIDLPVRGSLDDPEFSYGGVIMSALGNLLVKIVTSPFALLGNLVGAEADELEFIHFQPGRADLAPPELEKAAKLAEALMLRPELLLEFAGVSDSQNDGLALRTLKLEQLVELRMDLGEEQGSRALLYNEKQREVLEEIYREQSGSAEPDIALAELRQQFTESAGPDDPAGAANAVDVFDELAYLAQLRRSLIALQTVDDAAFVALATERASNAKNAVVAVDEALANRVRLGAALEVSGTADEPIEMKVTLTVNAE